MNNRSMKKERRSGSALGPAPNGEWRHLPEAIKYGDVCYQAERYPDALEAYTSALNSASRTGLTPELRARLHFRIAGCYMQRSQYRLALEQLDEARRVLPRHLDKVRLAKIYHRRGGIMFELGQYRRAHRYLSWARKMLRGTNEHEELAQAELRLGTVLVRQGRAAEARDVFLSALTTFRRIEHHHGEAAALNNLGLCYKNQCEYREAIHYLVEAVQVCERFGFRQRLASNHLNLGIVHFKLGKWELCEENLNTAHRMAGEVGSLQLETRADLALGNLHLRRREWESAEARYTKALEVSERESFAREQILAQEFLGELDYDRGNLDAAVIKLNRALERARDIAPEGDLVYEVLRRLSEVRLRQGDADEAMVLAKESAALASRVGDRYEEAVALRVVGLAVLSAGDREKGERIIVMGLDALATVGESFQKGTTHLEYGRWLAQATRESHSHEDLEAAGVQFQRAFGAFLDLDVRALAARAALERAELECDLQRFEEAASFRNKARQVLTSGSDPQVEADLARLGARLEDAFAERWATGGDGLTSLREVKRLFQGASDTDAALDELIRLAVNQSRSSRGCVAHVTADGVQVAAAFGWETADAQKLLDTLGGRLHEALRENRPVWASDVSAEDAFKVLAREEYGVRSLVILPFSMTEGKPGLLYVDRTQDNLEGGFYPGELQLLTLLANLAALSIVERWNTDLTRENRQLRRKIADEGQTRFITANPALLEHLRLVRKIADSPVSILITGETGTGKSLLAQVVHDASNRATQPFVQINCAALPEQLLESELFGHVKGAFTGATYNKVGLFQEAQGGTLFLDEVDKTSLAVQAKLLHVMDSREIRPVGSVKPITVDTRVIVASNTNLKKRIEAGEFLEDLYYRLNDFIVEVPPLRERREDLPLLVDHFLRKFSEQYGRPGARLSPEVQRVLVEQDWNGNVRELEKTIRRLVVLSDEDTLITSELLPPEIRLEPGDKTMGQTLREEVARTERRVIAEALRTSRGNKSAVARTLKVSYPSLLKKIKDYGLEPVK